MLQSWPDSSHLQAGVQRDSPRVTLGSPNVDWLIAIALKSWRWIALVTAILVIGTLLALPFLTPQYQISASMLVKLGREQAPEAMSGTGPGAVPFKRAEDVSSEIEIFQSQALIEDLVRSFGVDYFLARKPPVTAWERVKWTARSALDTVRHGVSSLLVMLRIEKPATPFERLVSVLRASISAEAIKRTDVIEVRLLTADRDSGMEVMNKLLDLFQAEHIRAHQNVGARHFLIDQVGAFRGELSRLETDRREFGKRHAVWDLEEQRKALLQEQRASRTSLSQTTEEIGRIESEVQYAETLLKSGPKEKRTSRVEQANPIASSMQIRLNERRANLERLRVTHGTASPAVREEEIEIRKLEQMLNNSARSMVATETYEISAGYVDAEKSLLERRRRLAGLSTQKVRQQEELVRIDAELDGLDRIAEQWRRLQREYQIAEQGFQLYARRLEEARISEALDAAQISNVSMIGTPTASVQPVKPKPKMLLAVALGCGIFGTFGLMLLLDAMRPRVHRPLDAAELLGAPVLAGLPEVRR